MSETNDQRIYDRCIIRVGQLEGENEKLRELCEDMLSCIEIRAAWHRPPTEEMCEEFVQRARELGIEEDG